MKRRVCIVTGSRAEYGILSWIIREVGADAALQRQLVVTGMHLAPEFGLTYRAIEDDGIRIDRKVEMLLSSDTPIGMAKSVGVGVLGFADALADLDPDVVVVLGDRFEMLAAAQAAFLCGIAVAHISGGEITEGAIDDSIRHAITKLSRYHFVAADPYRQRVIQLGEDPATVFDVGDPGLDSIARLRLLDREALANPTGIDPRRPFLLVTYHPLTVGAADIETGMLALLDALDSQPDCQILFTRPNADAGGRRLSGMLDNYAAARTDRVRVVASLGQLNYLSAMRHCAAVVGNSSSGIVEAPAMGRPTVNVGPRQDGRLKATSIVDCPAEQPAIEGALVRALSQDFQRAATATVSLYGQCNASTRIVQMLRHLDLTRNRAKRFHDLPC